MALKDYPEWVLAHKDHNKEIRCINGKYYLYQVHTSRIENKVKKVTDKYLGRITEDGIIPPTKKNIEYKVYEYSSACFIYNVCNSVISNIYSKYPSKYKYYLPNAFLRILFNNDINKWNKSYLSVLFKDFKIIKHTKSVEDEIQRIESMLSHFINNFLKNQTLFSFLESINDLYIVNVKDNYTLASYSEETKQILNKYNFKVDINHGKN